MIYVTSISEHSPVGDAHEVTIVFAVTDRASRDQLYRAFHREAAIGSGWDVQVVPDPGPEGFFGVPLRGGRS